MNKKNSDVRQKLVGLTVLLLFTVTTTQATEFKFDLNDTIRHSGSRFSAFTKNNDSWYSERISRLKRLKRLKYLKYLRYLRRTQTERNLMLYGDPQLGRVISIDTDLMQQVNSIDVPGENIYNTDQTNDDNKSYVMARGSNWIDVLERRSEYHRFHFTGKIELPFNPRTAVANKKLGLQLVSGSNKPMYALIDTTTDQVVSSGGMDYISTADVMDFGGSNATGHASWLTENIFVFPDRANRIINVYEVEKTDVKWVVTLTDQLSTASAVHNIEKVINADDSVSFYATLEGSPNNGIYPSVAELDFDINKLTILRQVHLDSASVENTGLHHISISPDGNDLYAGSAEGQVYIIDRDSMKTTHIIEAGKGASHVAFITEREMAIVVNHRATFVTVINTTTKTKIMDITVSGSEINNDILQSHSAIVSPDGQYYYNFATDNGVFFRIDLDTLEVDKQVYTGGTPKQGAAM